MAGTIKTETITLVAKVRDRGGLFRNPSTQSKSFRVIGTADLLHSLHVIKDASKEEHTRNNLTALIRQIEEANTDV